MLNCLHNGYAEYIPKAGQSVQHGSHDVSAFLWSGRQILPFDLVKMREGYSQLILMTTRGKHFRKRQARHQSHIPQCEEHDGQMPPFMRIDSDGTWFDVSFTHNRLDWGSPGQRQIESSAHA